MSEEQRFLGDAEQLYLENEGRVAWDAGLREFAIAFLSGDIHLPLVAHTHALHGDDPSVDEVAKANGERRAPSDESNFLPFMVRPV